jgi:formylglycine-generating enzyme required for sulfatase activity
MISNRFASLFILAWVFTWRASAGESAETATAVATINLGQVTAISVTSGGSGYIGTPIVTLSGGGGFGATAEAVLSGDRVVQIVVLNPGAGYSASPNVTIVPPRTFVGLNLDLATVNRIPKLTVGGPVRLPVRIEYAVSLDGPWVTWSNVVIGSSGTVLVDSFPRNINRFYRVVDDLEPIGPSGFVWVKPGTFLMGSDPMDDPLRTSDERQHPVRLTKGFWLSDHEVTQAEYRAVTGKSPSSAKGDNLPVEQVSWNDAAKYCQQLTLRERAAGRITAGQFYRLPTEAEWEYSARAGTITPHYGELDLIAWYSRNSGFKTQPVKQKQPNAWGLYDMIGNVWEWCADWYEDYPTELVIDPFGSSGSTGIGRHVIRGGDAGSDLRAARASARNGVSWLGDTGAPGLGFRPVLSR